MSYSYATCSDKSCCDKCQVCDNCDGGPNGECYLKQNFCSIMSQNALSDTGQSSPWPTFNSDDIIIKTLPRATYNSILNTIRTAYNFGTTANSGLSLSVAAETRDFIHADKTNEIIAAINALNGTVVSGVPTLQKDTDIVYARYFQAIRTGLQNMQLKEIQCHKCNTACDAQCEMCDGCDTCNTGACYTCVSCNNCNSVTAWACSEWGCSEWGCSEWGNSGP